MCRTMSGERGDMNENTVKNWKEKLPSICGGYEERDIFNMDERLESGVFFKQGRRSTYVPKDGDCARGKNAKDRVTVLLCTCMTGEKMKPLVVGRSKNPRCFKRVKLDSLPVTYRHNKKSWMID